MGLGNIVPRNANLKIYNPNENSWVSKKFSECIEGGYLTKGRKPGLRPSAFPTCSVLNWMIKYRGEKTGYIDKREFSMEYYTSVGTTVHEVSQFFMGFSGVNYGHWKCVNPECKHGKAAMETRTADGRIIKEGKFTREFSVDNICPSCKKPMFFNEVKVEYGKGVRKLRGYVDGIWLMEDGETFWIVDYKTTSMKKIEQGKYPEKVHLWQLPLYAYILEKKYKMKIGGFSLIYVPRDNPRNFYEYREKWGKKWKKWSKDCLTEEQDRFEALDKDIRDGTFHRVIKTKPCSTESEYFNKMHCYDECPMLDVCFSERHLQKRLKLWKKLVDKKKLSDGTFETAVDVLLQHEAAGLGIGSRSKKKEKRSSKEPRTGVKHISI